MAKKSGTKKQMSQSTENNNNNMLEVDSLLKDSSKDEPSNSMVNELHNSKNKTKMRMRAVRVKDVKRFRQLYNTPYTRMVRYGMKSDNIKKINLSLDNMLSASHALSIYKNGRELSLEQYTPAARNYVIKIINKGDVDNSLLELNRQIAAKISEE